MALFAALPARALDARAAFHASKAWAGFVSQGVVLREQWLDVEGSAFALVHAVRTDDDGFRGELFAVEASSGAVWPGELQLEACPPLETVKSMRVLYRHGGGVQVRLAQSEWPKKPFGSCDELRRAALAGCTVRVPVKLDAEQLASGPDQAKLGSGWVAASAGRVDAPKSPSAGLKLTTALRECLGEDDTPLLAPLEDRLALAGSKSVLLVSEALTSTCAPCEHDGTWALPGPPGSDEVKRRGAQAQAAWRAGRRDAALEQWRDLFRWYWAGPRERSVVWAETLEQFGAALGAMREPLQARQVLDECWLTSKAPTASLMSTMGDVFRELGDVDAAVAAYQRVLAADASRAQREHALAELARLRKPR
ncbi:MAG: hypothetical protein IPJ65_19270 [Archangiaceae bacterium]|nr:hypothetical protein [Archangiaceae bacterium]